MTKGKRILLTVISVLVLCTAIFGILWGISGGELSDIRNIFGNHTDDEQKSKIEATAEDAETLRELLAKDAEITIHITDDMEVEEGFIVNGTKTLTGDAALKMALGAELGQALLKITENSSLTFDGPVLDCNFNSDGIHVEPNATLTSLSGTIKYAGAYGILTYGKVTIKDINIKDSEYISICAQTDSKVNIKGGSIERSASNDVYLVNGAYVNISGNTVMEGATEHGIINYGTLEINDGKFGNVNNYLCDNYGKLTVAYKGNAEDGTIEFYGARNSVFLIRKGSVANISDIYIHDTQRQGIASLGGDTNISNCTIEGTGSHGIDIQAGEATVENVIVTNSKGSGMEASGGSKVKVTNFTVDACEKIGLASRGANVTASKIDIKNTGRYGITCGDTKKGQGILLVEDAEIQDATMHGIYVYEKAEAELKNIKVSGGEARGMYVAKTATCKLSGESIIKKNVKGGVEVRGDLQLDSVVICDNNVKNSGAGVYVADGGKVTMNGGSVYNNNSELRGGGIVVSDATLTINGSKIYNNHSVNHGGGLYAQKKAVVNLNSGEITKNTSENNGDGIYVLSAETKVTMGENFYLGGNDVKLENVKTVLHIQGNSLKRHSATDPLLLTPNYNAEEGTKLATCKNESIAKSIAASVKSGDGSYNVIRDKQHFAIQYATADMDMTGADTVKVSNFQELKEAVLSTTSKRYIVLSADIAMEERIRVPGGVTICIKDDGTQRTLTRANDFTDSFFVTHYGTGLYLTGTDTNKLVLDGDYLASADETKNQSLIRVAGSTELKNVVLQNNGTSVYKNQVRGALMRQLYGDFKIYDSVFSGGTAYSGGALMIDKGIGYIEGSTFKDNASTIGGGAIRAAGGCKLDVVSSTISGNHAGSTGGGIVALEASKVTVKNTNLENNTAISYGGALSAQDEGTTISVIGTDTASAIVKNNSAKTAGAIYMTTKSQLEVSGYVFENNAATDGRAGAISVISNASATIENTAFYGNKATGSGGALVADNSKVNIVSCEFGKENAGNEAGDKAGAILVAGKAVVDMKTVKDGKYNSINYNVAKGEYGGGAIYADKDAALTAKNYIFEGNKGLSGGAIYVAIGGKAVCQDNQFVNNTAISGETYKNGGAVYCAGTFEDTNSSYSGNAARNGGALIVMNGGNATLKGTSADAVMNGNSANATGGGALYVNGGGFAKVTGYVFDSNQAASGGAIYVVGQTKDVKAGEVIGENNQFTSNQSTATGDKVGGGAVYCAGTFTDKNGNSYHGNSAKNGGALYANSGANVSISGATYEANVTSNGTGGAICVIEGATVDCENATFENNKTNGNGSYKNGGAVYTQGTFTDTNSKYTGNNARNGGAFFVAAGNATVKGTDAAKAIMQSNKAVDASGGAIYVNGGTLLLTGYKLEANTGKTYSDNAVHVAAGGAVLSNVNFAGDKTQNVQVQTNFTFDNLSGKVCLVQNKDTAKFVVNGQQDANVVAFEPKTYSVGKVVLQKAEEGITAGEFKNVCGAIDVAPSSDGSSWYIDEDGKLVKNIVATITTSAGIEEFGTLKAAVEYANTNGGTGNAAAIEIVILANTATDETLNITKNITILNKAGDEVTIGRGTQDAFDLFTVAENVTLTLGTNAKDATGKLIIDGATTSAIAGRTVTVSANAGFVLAKNATLQNANSTVTGAAVQTASANTVIYGAIKDNLTTADAGGMDVQSGASATINGAIFSGNHAKAAPAALCIRSNAVVTSTNATFSNNENIGNANAGAVYCAGTFRDTNSTYVGNKAKNGGAIFVAGGSATLVGTDSDKAVFKNNAVSGATNADGSRGGAVFVNGGSISIIGYTFEGNTSVSRNYPNGVIHVAANRSATLINVTLQGDVEQKVYVLGNLTYNGLSNAVVDKNTSEANLVHVVASATASDGSTTYFETLVAAVAYANQNGGTGTTDAVEITVLENVSIDAELSIEKNITILNYEGKEVTISRASDSVYNMFNIKAGSTLLLGRNSTEGTGKLIVDGTTTTAIAGSTVWVNDGARFTLEKNATLQGANSTQTGGAVYTESKNVDAVNLETATPEDNMVVIKGSIQNNKSTVQGAGVYVAEGANLGIYGGVFYANESTSDVGGAICIIKNAVVICQEAFFEKNETSNAKNGGAVYCQGTFKDANSKYTENKAKNGGAIFIPAGGNVTLIGTDTTKAIFLNNQARGASTSKGGAIYVNGGSLNVSGYTFTANTCTQSVDSAEKVAVWKASGSYESQNVTFQ